MQEKCVQKICPFCRQDNQCGIDECEKCWCFSVKVPSELLSLLPIEFKDKSCICFECIEKFKINRLGFLEKFKS